MSRILLLLTFICTLTSFKPKQITWTAIGDSITYLNDHKSETKNRISSGYMARVVDKLPNVEYVNQGHNGWTAVGIAKEIENLGLIKTDVYSVFLGTNDWWSGLQLGNLDDYINDTGLKTVFGAYRIIIKKIKTLNPDAKIILITPMQRADFVYISDSHNNAWGSYKEKSGQKLSQFADAVKQIGRKEHFEVVDLYNNKNLSLNTLVKYKRLKDPKTGEYKNYPYPDFIGIPFNPDTDDYPYPVNAADNTYDGLHPSDNGYQIIANLLVNIIKKY